MLEPGLEPQLSIDEARQILRQVFQGYPIKIYLFGSRAQGTARRASDIDIGLLASFPIPAGLLNQAKEFLEESTIPYKIDLIDLSQVEPGFRKKVQSEGILWTDLSSA